jgi:hypothetical protein
MIATGRRICLGLALVLVGCEAKSHRLFEEQTQEVDATVDAGNVGGGELPLAPGCKYDISRVPGLLECTGLYASVADLGKKKLAKAIRSFVPAAPLWSDGADKERWIWLPPDTQIDTSNPEHWVFPVGTKVWKEFRVGAKRIETRIFWKVDETTWRRGTYAWNADETEAKLEFGRDITLPDGSPYHIPDQEECDRCHKGEPDRVLGFSAINLGLEGASGITLAQLVDEGLLSDPPELVRLSIGADRAGLDDDGVPLAAKALPILHTNCGLTCHNTTPGRDANLTMQNLRLNLNQLDGRAPDETWNVFHTAVNKMTEGAQLGGMFPRIAAGDPKNSYVITMMNSRNAKGMGAGQMPPLATRIVDKASVDIISRWITRLAQPTPDAGPADAGVDASMADAGPMDAGMDSGGEDSGADAGLDATLSDAETDAGTDAGMDAEIDAEIDAEVDANVDAEVDASEDAEIDAGTPLDPDAGTPSVN